jgi:hypothetical protein
MSAAPRELRERDRARIERWMDVMGLEFADLGFFKNVTRYEQLDGDEIASLLESIEEDIVSDRYDDDLKDPCDTGAP